MFQCPLQIYHVQLGIIGKRCHKFPTQLAPNLLHWEYGSWSVCSSFLRVCWCSLNPLTQWSRSLALKATPNSWYFTQNPHILGQRKLLTIFLHSCWDLGLLEGKEHLTFHFQPWPSPNHPLLACPWSQHRYKSLQTACWTAMVGRCSFSLDS
jgi:hypothetical protein